MPGGNVHQGGLRASRRAGRGRDPRRAAAWREAQLPGGCCRRLHSLNSSSGVLPALHGNAEAHVPQRAPPPQRPRQQPRLETPRRGPWRTRRRVRRQMGHHPLPGGRPQRPSVALHACVPGMQAAVLRGVQQRVGPPAAHARHRAPLPGGGGSDGRAHRGMAPPPAGRVVHPPQVQGPVFAAGGDARSPVRAAHAEDSAPLCRVSQGTPERGFVLHCSTIPHLNGLVRRGSREEPAASPHCHLIHRPSMLCQVSDQDAAGLPGLGGGGPRGDGDGAAACHQGSPSLFGVAHPPTAATGAGRRGAVPSRQRQRLLQAQRQPPR
mmetsp:Transcript_17203/g.51468  ORF Transcript_17203/g.51468 Transcript_17203/m.51468 type:complete len:322 (-) Transcript_17203:642-1607(-)